MYIHSQELYSCLCYIGWGSLLFTSMKGITVLILSLVLLSSAFNKPNILFILTDDQDVTANSLDYMPQLNRILRKEGMEFLNYFVTTALCCPSRATIIRGQYCHNTGIWDNGDLNNNTFMSGGFAKWIANGLHDTTIATMLHNAGYETYLVGKYLNGYNDKNAHIVPPGWDHWQGMTNMAYYGPHFSDEGQLLKVPNTVYQTDYISNKAATWLRQRSSEKPFFMYVAPFAPHAPSTPAHRHANLFNDKQAPRFESFNPDEKVQKEKPSWLGRLPKLTKDQIDHVDEFYRNRLRALQAVDEMLSNLTTLLDKLAELDNTYIFYMGDNGQHLGDYRLSGGKRQAYDTDIRVPFLVRGPGVQGGTRVTEIVQNIDLMPTWIELAGGQITPGYKNDGKSIVPLLHKQQELQPSVNQFRSVSLAEMYGGSSNMGGNIYHTMAGYEKGRFWNNTYQAIRVINGSDWTSNANWMYAEWCTGENEFYNITDDPREISNVVSQLTPKMISMLSLLVAQLGNCSGSECHTVDYVKIRQKVENGIQPTTKQLPCHNPPDMPSKDTPNIFSVVAEQLNPSVCQDVLYNGFPFSDEDVVPEELLHIWTLCQNQ